MLLINHKRLFHSGIAKKLSRFGYFNIEDSIFSFFAWLMTLSMAPKAINETHRAHHRPFKLTQA